MAAHKVKCLYCKQIFDTNSEDFVKIGRRYAHKKCAEEHPDENTEAIEKDKFFSYLKEIYGKDYNFIANEKLAESYKKKYSWNYAGMLIALKYFYEVKGNPPDKKKTIGIIPYIYEEAQKYYVVIEQKKKEVEESAAEVPQYESQTVWINRPDSKREIKLFDF